MIKLDEEKKGMVAIRGIDKRLYGKLASIAKDSGKTIGEIMNEAMRIFLITTQKVAETGANIAKTLLEEKGVRELEGVEEIGNLEELEVTREDLEEVEKVAFKNVKVLKFSPDIPYELFEKKVSAIVLCDRVIIPKGFPKLKVAKKLRYCKKIEQEE